MEIHPRPEEKTIISLDECAAQLSLSVEALDLFESQLWLLTVVLFPLWFCSVGLLTVFCLFV